MCMRERKAEMCMRERKAEMFMRVRKQQIPSQEARRPLVLRTEHWNAPGAVAVLTLTD